MKRDMEIPDEEEFEDDEAIDEEPKRVGRPRKEEVRQETRNPERKESVKEKETKKFVAFHSPERIGIRTGEGEEWDLYTALAEMLNYLERIEYYIGK